jgi:hypothetical protein
MLPELPTPEPAQAVGLSARNSVPLFFLVICICYGGAKRGKITTCSINEVRNFERTPRMRIAKPILLVTTPIGLIDGFYECYKLAGGLVFLMVAMVGALGVAMATVIATIRREGSAGAKEDRWPS